MMRRCLLVTVLAGLTGCLAYNVECPSDDSAVLGRTESLLDLRRTFLRTREAPIGNLIADAFYDHMRAQFQPDDKVIAVVNAGSIRDRNDCRITEFIERCQLILIIQIHYEYPVGLIFEFIQNEWGMGGKQYCELMLLCTIAQSLQYSFNCKWMKSVFRFIYADDTSIRGGAGGHEVQH